MLIGARYRSLEALQYINNARDVSHWVHYQMRSEMIDGYKAGNGGEAYQQRQVVPHLIRFKHHLPVYQIVLTDHLLTLPLLSRGEAPLNPEVSTRVPRYPTSPAVPSEGTSHHSPYLTQVSGISASGPKVYSV